MSLSKYESQVRHLPQPQQAVYDRFSDLRNIGALKEKLNSPEFQDAVAEHLPGDKLEEARQQLEGMTCEQDSVSLSTPLGAITLRIVEREAPKLLKFASEGSPLPLKLWIQLLPAEDGGSLMRVTVGAEVNMFMKGIVGKPLQQAADRLADVLCAVGGQGGNDAGLRPAAQAT